MHHRGTCPDFLPHEGNLRATPAEEEAGSWRGA